jgi:GT2 family glycosyltransferase
LKLSVVILNYNVRHFLELCIKSVQAAIASIDAEIIVIDNNSTDGSCKMVMYLFPEITLIQNKENLGFSKANNIGVSCAKGEYVCILNPDTVVAENTFTSILSFAEGRTDLGIVGCRLIDGTGQFLPESKRNTPVLKVAIQKLFKNSKSYYANHLDETDTGKVDVLVGAFMFMRREVYNRVDGFDEDYFLYGEDIDLSYRVLNAGFSNYYFGNTTIIHFKGESTLKDKSYARHFYNAMQIFYKKHFSNNVLFDAFVWLGIKLIKLLKAKTFIDRPEAERYILNSDKIKKTLSKTLPYRMIFKSHEEKVQDHTQMVLDANSLSYKAIIESISDNYPNTGKSFKILPKNSTFILGSDGSEKKGEVISHV